MALSDSLPQGSLEILGGLGAGKVGRGDLSPRSEFACCRPSPPGSYELGRSERAHAKHPQKQTSSESGFSGDGPGSPLRRLDVLTLSLAGP